MRGGIGRAAHRFAVYIDEMLGVLDVAGTKPHGGRILMRDAQHRRAVLLGTLLREQVGWDTASPFGQRTAPRADCGFQARADMAANQSR